MIPYADFTFFGLLLYAALPTIGLGFFRGAGRRWTLCVTLVYLAAQYWGNLQVTSHAAVPSLAIVAGYAAYQWVVVMGFLALRRRPARSFKRFAVTAAVILALAPLAVAKFLPLFPAHAEFGFLGISYVTFRALDLIFCVQDGLVGALPASDFIVYLFFFATISSGPIDRYRRFEKDWRHNRTREEFLADLDGAIQRLFRGFLYKFLLAALIKTYWMDRIIGGGVLHTVSYMYAYSLYLFFDFAGYSAFAISISYLFGIHTPENFDRPFLARNIRDFWNRWHITLSFWFRDHVYMRFLLTAAKGKWFKNRNTASYLGFFLSFGLMGIWHGTALHYIVYGLYHATLLSAYDFFSRWNKRHHWWGTGGFWHPASVFLTAHAVCFGFLIFSGRLG